MLLHQPPIHNPRSRLDILSQPSRPGTPRSRPIPSARTAYANAMGLLYQLLGLAAAMQLLGSSQGEGLPAIDPCKMAPFPHFPSTPRPGHRFNHPLTRPHNPFAPILGYCTRRSATPPPPNLHQSHQYLWASTLPSRSRASSRCKFRNTLAVRSASRPHHRKSWSTGRTEGLSR